MPGAIVFAAAGMLLVWRVFVRVFMLGMLMLRVIVLLRHAKLVSCRCSVAAATVLGLASGRTFALGQELLAAAIAAEVIGGTIAGGRQGFLLVDFHVTDWVDSHRFTCA